MNQLTERCLKIACPKCHAGVGERCDPMPQPHEIQSYVPVHRERYLARPLAKEKPSQLKKRGII